MKKPDKFERMVLAEFKRQDKTLNKLFNDPTIWLNGPDIVKMLRRQHEAYRRMLLRGKKFWSGDDYGSHCRWSQCVDLLQELKEWRR